MVIHSYETERFCLAGLLRFPNLFHEVEHFVTDYDFVSRLNRTVFSVVKSFLVKGQELNDFLISEKIKNLNIRFEETDIEIMDYIESLKILQVNEKSAITFFQKLKQISTRREIDEVAQKLSASMKKADDASLDEIVEMADLLYNEKMNMFTVDQDFQNIYDSLQDKIEERGENPVDEIGYMGPFPKMNELYGSLLRKGGITIWGARTGVGKTTIGMYYMNYVAEKYDLPILHLDQGEMSIEELQYRAVSMFTGGKVSYDALEHGYWRKNAEMTRLVREVWPRVKKLKLYYYDISDLSPKEIITLIRRFYLRKVGRGKDFLTHLDYLKPFDLDNVHTKEYQVMGTFLKKIKALYKRELENPFWSSIQLNRTGITGNKPLAQIDDTENTFGTSDQVSQQSSHSFIARYKVPEELAAECNKYGNVKGICVKHRHLGRNAHDATSWVRLPSGLLVRNYVHMNINSFHIEERGDLASTVKNFGILTPDNHHHTTSGAVAAAGDTSGELEDPDLL